MEKDRDRERKREREEKERGGGGKEREREWNSAGRASLLDDVSPMTLVSEHNLTTHAQHRSPYWPQLLSLRSLEGTMQLLSKYSFLKKNTFLS